MENTAMPETVRAQPCGACSFLGEICLTNCFWAPYFKPDEYEKFSLLIDGTTPRCFKAKLRQINPDKRQQAIDDLYNEKKEMKSEQEKTKAVLAADSESFNQHKSKTVVDAAEDSSNHCKWLAAKRARTQCTKSCYPKRGVHDSGIGLKPRKCFPTPWSTKSCSNVAEDSLNHHKGKAVIDFGFKWASKRSRTCRPTDQLLLLARSAEIFKAADTLFEMANGVDQKAKAKEAEKEEASLRNEKAEQSEKEEASLRNEKAEQAEKEQAERPEK